MPWPMYALWNRIQDANFKMKNDTMGHVKKLVFFSLVFLVRKTPKFVTRVSLFLYFVFHSFFMFEIHVSEHEFSP